MPISNPLSARVALSGSLSYDVILGWPPTPLYIKLFSGHRRDRSIAFVSNIMTLVSKNRIKIYI
jgi:hypothetical protein